MLLHERCSVQTVAYRCLLAYSLQRSYVTRHAGMHLENSHFQASSNSKVILYEAKKLGWAPLKGISTAIQISELKATKN